MVKTKEFPDYFKCLFELMLHIPINSNGHVRNGWETFLHRSCLIACIVVSFPDHFTWEFSSATNSKYVILNDTVTRLSAVLLNDTVTRLSAVLLNDTVTRLCAVLLNDTVTRLCAVLLNDTVTQLCASRFQTKDHWMQS